MKNKFQPKRCKLFFNHLFNLSSFIKLNEKQLIKYFKEMYIFKNEEQSNVFILNNKNICKILWTNCVEHHKYFK